MKDSDDQKQEQQETRYPWSQEQTRQMQLKRNRSIGDQRRMERKYRTKRRTQQRELQFLEMTLQEANKARFQAQNRIKATQEAMWRKQTKLENAQYQIENLEVEKKGMKAQLRQLQDEIKRASQAWKAQQAERKLAHEQNNASMKGQIKRLQDQVNKKSKAAARRQAELQELYNRKQNQKAQIQRQLDETRATASGLEIEMQTLRIQMQTNQLIINQAKNRIAQQTAENDRFLIIIQETQRRLQMSIRYEEQERKARQELENRVVILTQSQKKLQHIVVSHEQEEARLKALNQSAHLIQRGLRQSLRDLQLQIQANRLDYPRKLAQIEATHRNMIVRLQNEYTAALIKEKEQQKINNQQIAKQLDKLEELRRSGDIKIEQYRRHAQQLEKAKQAEGKSFETAMKALQAAHQVEIRGLKEQFSEMMTQLQKKALVQSAQKRLLQGQIRTFQQQLQQLRAQEQGHKMYETQLQTLLKETKLAMEAASYQNHSVIRELTLQNKKIQSSLAESTQAQVRNAELYQRQLTMSTNKIRQSTQEISRLQLIIAKRQSELKLSNEQRQILLSEINRLKRELRQLPQAIVKDIQFKKAALRRMKESANQIHELDSYHYTPPPRQLAIARQANETWVPRSDEQVILMFKLDPSQQVNEDVQFRGSIQYGNSQLKLTQKSNGQVWIGIQIKKPHRSFFTKNCIHLPKKLLKAIPGSFEQLISVKSAAKITIMLTSQLAMIRDIYKERRYYGLRMMKYYQGNPTPTKNGFNLTKTEMSRLSDYILNLK